MAHTYTTYPLLVHYEKDSPKRLKLGKQEHGLSETKLTILAVDYVLSNPELLKKLVKEEKEEVMK